MFCKLDFYNMLEITLKYSRYKLKTSNVHIYSNIESFTF